MRFEFFKRKEKKPEEQEQGNEKRQEWSDGDLRMQKEVEKKFLNGEEVEIQEQALKNEPHVGDVVGVWAGERYESMTKAGSAEIVKVEQTSKELTDARGGIPQYKVTVKKA